METEDIFERKKENLKYASALKRIKEAQRTIERIDAARMARKNSTSKRDKAYERWKKALALLETGMTLTEAGKEIGVSPTRVSVMANRARLENMIRIRRPAT